MKPIRPPADVDFTSRTFSGRIPPAATATAQVAPTGVGLPFPLNLQGTTTAVTGEPVGLCNAMHPDDVPAVPIVKASV